MRNQLRKVKKAFLRLLQGARNLRLTAYLRGKRCQVKGKVHALGPHMPYVENQGQIVIESGVLFRNRSFKSELQTFMNGNIHIGRKCKINQGVTIASVESVEIGPNTLIGEHVAIHDTNFHPIAPDQSARKGKVTIGRNVWLGHRVIVLQGVTIGDHTIVAAGSVVTRPLPPRCVAAGAPAKPVKHFECADDWIRPSLFD